MLVWPLVRLQFEQLEAVASTASQEELDADGALAALCSRHGRYFIRRTTVLIGRGSDTKGAVDVDLSMAGSTALENAAGAEDGQEGELAGAGTATISGTAAAAAAKVSRRQAFLSLRPDGSWWLENVGRRKLSVDGSVLGQVRKGV